MKIGELRQKYGDIIDRRNKMVEAAEEADRDFDEGEKREWDETAKQLADLKERIDRQAVVESEQRDASRPQIDPIRPVPGEGNGQPAKDRRTLGQRLIDSDEYKSFVVRNGSRLQSGDVKTIQHMQPFEARAILTLGATSGGALTSPMDSGVIVELGRKPLTLLDLVTQGSTSTDIVEFVRVTAETSGAAVVAEASAATGTSGLKPESSMALERVSTPVKTVAHWMASTTRALADAGQLRTMVDNFLRYGLEEELEDQILNGDGTGENFTGIANTSNVQAQAFVTNVLTTTRQARRKVRTVGRAIPTAFAFNPIDWEAIDLLQDNEGRYYYGGPADMGQPRLWGLPVVESEAVPAGTAYVGDWRMAALWDREAATISTGTIDDDFVRNIIRILAELRAAFGVLKPTAFVEIALSV